ncbi:MAG TPA: M48 family metalloprotease [Caldisericia bacterium]|nr:M48 family metalloprotease [Caldisericia bacterium]
MIYDEISRNKRDSFFLILFFSVFVVLAGYFIGEAWMKGGGPLGIAIGFGISLIMSLVSFYSGDKVILASVGAQKASRDSHPQLINIVEELTIASGLPLPEIYVVPDASPNAFAAGRDPQHSIVAVNEGLLRMLNREELQGVIAHELSHIQNRDILYATIVAVLLGMVVILSTIFRNSWMFGGSRRRDDRDSSGGMIILIGILFAILAPIAAKLIQLAISRKREYLADSSAALMTRNPSGLASALQKLYNSNIPSQRVNEAIAPLYIAPLKGKNLQILFSTHPPISDRIKRLTQMAYKV